jgi:hypothetical protein
MSGIVAGVGAKMILDALLKRVAGAARGAVGFVAAHWKVALPVIGAAFILVYVLILASEVRHRDKEIASQASLIASIRNEVDRGVGKATEANDAPTYVRGFVDNLATMMAALDRQSAALKAAQGEADAHTEAAHQAAQPTPKQQLREKDRQTIVQGTGALTPQDWEKL